MTNLVQEIFNIVYAGDLGQFYQYVDPDSNMDKELRAKIRNLLQLVIDDVWDQGLNRGRYNTGLTLEECFNKYLEKYLYEPD